MHLRQLEVFRAVMAAGTTTGAALTLGVSQPAVSRMIADVEEGLGMQLFERSKGRLVATDEAVHLYKEIEPLFLALEATKARVRDIRDGSIGNIRIVASSSLASSVVPDAIRSILEKTPDVKITLEVQNWDRAAEQVEANIADIGIVFTVGDRPRLITKPLYLGKMVCVMARDHPLARQPVIRPGDLQGHRIIRLSPTSPLGELISIPLEKNAIEINAVVQTRYCNMICALAQSGVGVGIVDQFIVSSMSYPGLVVKQFVPTINLTAYALISRDRPISRLIKRTIKELEEVFMKIAEQDARHEHNPDMRQDP
ncbi:MAG: LysR substrate-binding domain-containing protein [Aquamicrobium sp.]|uniref:LysR family transcriptional regulator n=1 Tax=Aquamicrobium sp. TaxID=1872579 RepID=UPI00349E5087|nr:LysR substrate-binding domain-containing protein [Aquamicrobium sp.]MCO5155516.1 LysR substrate-binding domain-containing protein [Aquamicrobium sp.]